MPDYDEASLDATRTALLRLGKGLHGFERSFGAKGEVDPVRHLIATASGWGGLPDHEATYLNVNPGLPRGEYSSRCVTCRSTASDLSRSATPTGTSNAYDRDAYSVNNLTAARDEDGTVTIHFGGCGDGRPNCLPVTYGWNYLVPLVPSRAEILNGTWIFPSLTPTAG